MTQKTLIALIATMTVTFPMSLRAQQLSQSTARALESLRASAEVVQVQPADDGRSVRLVRGRLTPQSTATPEEIVRDLLASRGGLFNVHDVDALELRRIVDMGSTRIVRLGQTVDGVPVVGADVTALIDRQGQVRLVVQSLVEPILLGEPMIEPREAAEIGAGALIRPAGEPNASQAVLVYLPTGPGLVPAYAVYFGRVPALLANWHAFVNAVTGQVITSFNRVATDRTGLVWSENPVASGEEPEPVVLEPLDLEDLDCIAADSVPPTDANGDPLPDEEFPLLCTPRVSARSCWDFHDTIELEVPLLGRINVHTCTEYHMAFPNDAPAEVEDPDDDIANDFYYDDYAGDLDYDYADDAEAGQDLFAEQHLLHHVERIHDHFDTFDPDLFEGLQGGQILAAANWRLPIDVMELAANPTMTAIMAALAEATNPAGRLYPMDNAMFMPGGNLYGIIERPYHSLMFFQGNHRDFAYDADVIYHEFTHAVVDTVVGGVGLMLSRRDEQGLHTMSRAMNEAYADFFATSFHDNPLQGEYAMSGPDMPGPRDLAARPRSTCPARMINEEHYDSAPYSEALWEIREALDPEAFERAAFAALCTLPPNASFHEGAAATVAAVEVELGNDEAETAADIFTAYGYGEDAQCQRVVELDLGATVEQINLHGTQLEAFTVAPYAPSVVQFRVHVPAGARQLRLRYVLAGSMDPESFLTGGSAAPALLVRHGDEPITFSTAGAVSSDAEDLIEAVEDDPARRGGSRLVYHRDGEELAEGSWHVMVVNTSQTAGLLAGIEIETTDEMPDVTNPDGGVDGDGDVDADADGDTDDDSDGDADAEDDTTDDGGCGCRAVGARHLAGMRALSLI